MGTATKMLREEHDAILRMLDATEEVARQLERGERVAPETLTGLLEFFRLFVHHCHYGKEEDWFFPLLKEKGLPWAGECVELMLAEHEQGWLLFGQMMKTTDAYASGSAEAAVRWAEAARNYVALLRQHIHRENDVLFVMAEKLFTEVEQNELAEAFAKVEKEKMGAGTHERLHAFMEKLSRDILQA